MKQHVIYVPGLGRPRQSEKWLLQTWRWRGVQPHYFASNWPADEPYAAKQDRLIAHIDRLSQRGHTVSLVGVSAGGSLAINAFFERRDTVHRALTICGKLAHPEAVEEHFYRNNPALRDSFLRLEIVKNALTAQDKAHLLTVSPRHDEVVPLRDQVIPGVAAHTIPTSGHALSIVLAIARHARPLIGFIRDGKLPSKS